MTTRATLETKQRLVAQLIGPNAKSALQLSKELGKGGVSQTTLLRWKKELEPMPLGALPRGERPIDRFSNTDKYELVMQVVNMDIEKGDELLQKKGITRDMFDEWKRDFMFSRLTPPPAKNEPISILQKENEVLKARLSRLEKNVHMVEEVLVARLTEERRAN